VLALWHAESLELMRALPAACVDGVITDPPYSSGGAFRGDRVTRNATAKYISGEDRHLYAHDFHGDTRDQRGFAYWCTLWLSEAYRLTKPGGIVALFIDWRQLPTLTDAVQAAGWSWRGVAVWDKKAGRPQKGRFKAQAEFIVWGSKGGMPLDGPCHHGVFRCTVPRGKSHPTEKPVDMLRDVVKIARPGGVILDPFMGSGAVGEAALSEGYGFLGCELSAHYAEASAARLAQITSTIAPERRTQLDPILAGAA